MRFGLLLLTACEVAPSEVPEAPEAAPPEVAAQIYVLGEGSGEAVLYWPSLPTAPPIPVRSNPGNPDQPWTGPVPTGQTRAMSVWVDPGDLVEIRERVARAGVPSLAPPSLVEIEARSFPGCASVVSSSPMPSPTARWSAPPRPTSTSCGSTAPA